MMLRLCFVYCQGVGRTALGMALLHQSHACPASVKESEPALAVLVWSHTAHRQSTMTKLTCTVEYAVGTAKNVALR